MNIITEYNLNKHQSTIDGAVVLGDFEIDVKAVKNRTVDKLNTF